MVRAFRALLVLGLWCAAGCEVRQEYFLNPDGSGKVRLDRSLPPEAMSEESRNQLVRLLLDSKGVAAWSHLAVVLNQDGTVHAKATAYFKDLNALKLSSDGPAIKPTLARDEGGQLVVTLPLQRDSSPTSAPAAATRPDEATIKANIQGLRDRYAAHQANVPLSQMRATYTFHLPGKVAATQTFEKLDDTTVQLDLEGAKVVKAVEGFINDDAAMRPLALQTVGKPQVDTVLNAGLKRAYGEALLARAVSAAATPTFDYAAEVAKAKPGTVATLIAAGVLPAEPPAAPPEGALTGFKVRHLSNPTPGSVSLTLDATLPFKAALNERLTLYWGQDERGNYLFPSAAHPRLLIDFGRPLNNEGDDGRTLTAYAGFALPTGTQRLARAVGVWRVGVASGVRKVDLGEIELKTGAVGKLMGLTIVSLSDNPGSTPGSREGSVNVMMDRSASGVRDVEFLDESGKHLFSFAHNPGQPWKFPAGFYFQRATGLPPKAKAVATVYDDYRTVELPVELKDISLRAPAGEADKAKTPRP